MFDFLKGVAIKDGGNLPPSLAKMPILKPSLQRYYDAYQVLSGSRQFTMGGPTAIPFSEIASYLGVFKINKVSEREKYVTYIQSLDNCYLDYQFKKRPKGKT